MAEMAEMLEEVAAGKARPVVLIEGDEYLARTSAASWRTRSSRRRTAR